MAANCSSKICSHNEKERNVWPLLDGKHMASYVAERTVKVK